MLNGEPSIDSTTTRPLRFCPARRDQGRHGSDGQRDLGLELDDLDDRVPVDQELDLRRLGTDVRGFVEHRPEFGALQGADRGPRDVVERGALAGGLGREDQSGSVPRLINMTAPSAAVFRGDAEVEPPADRGRGAPGHARRDDRRRRRGLDGRGCFHPWAWPQGPPRPAPPSPFLPDPPPPHPTRVSPSTRAGRVRNRRAVVRWAS